MCGDFAVIIEGKKLQKMEPLKTTEMIYPCIHSVALKQTFFAIYVWRGGPGEASVDVLSAEILPSAHRTHSELTSFIIC